MFFPLFLVFLCLYVMYVSYGSFNVSSNRPYQLPMVCARSTDFVCHVGRVTSYDYLSLLNGQLHYIDSIVVVSGARYVNVSIAIFWHVDVANFHGRRVFAVYVLCHLGLLFWIVWYSVPM